MRPIQEIYHQLLWDPRFQAGSYRLGVQTREGPIHEHPVLTYQPGGDIPWHRILYVRGPQGLIWDRRTGLEDVHPAASALGPGERISVLTWNVGSGRHSLPLAPRLQRLLQVLDPLPADIVALQEVGPELAAVLPAHPQRFACGELVVYCRFPPERVQEVTLSTHKPALLVHFAEFSVAVVHLTSDFRGDASALRQQQWNALARYLEGRPWLVLGDLNDSGTLLHQGVDLTPAQPSYRPEKNPWAQQTTQRGRPARFQRILASGWSAESATVDHEVQSSDHDPVLAVLQRQHLAGTSVRNALAVLLPARLLDAVQRIRAEHDPGYRRWMPHLNLVYPAPEALDSEAVRRAVAEVSRFVCRLDGVGIFQHRGSQTAHWKPEPAANVEFEKLHVKLCERLGLKPRLPFVAHLTIARGKLLASERFASQLGAAEFTVSALNYLQREAEGPFRVVSAFPLSPPAAVPEWVPRPVHVVGSTLLERGSDLDLVVVSDDPTGLQTSLLEQVPHLRPVGSVLRTAGLDLALALRNPDELHWQAVLDWEALFTRVMQQRDLEVFQADYACFDAWLLARGLKGQAWGWPGGLAWAAVLLEPEFVWSTPLVVPSPAFPSRNLTGHVPGFLVPVLVEETKLQVEQPYEVPLPYLEVDDVGGRGLGFIVEVHRRYGLSLRPCCRPAGCRLHVPRQAAAALLQLARERFGDAVELIDS